MKLFLLGVQNENTRNLNFVIWRKSDIDSFTPGGEKKKDLINIIVELEVSFKRRLIHCTLRFSKKNRQVHIML